MSETIPYVTIILLCTIGVISISGFNNYSVIEYMRHYPYQEHRDKSYYRWLSCGFVHGSYIHLILNAFVLWQFGFVIEKMYIAKFGSVPGMSLYLSAYLLILVLSCVPTYIKHKNNSSYASIGASGAISGILFIYIYHFPNAILSLYGIIPLPAFAMGILYLVYSWWAAKQSRDGIDHDAHYYGAVMGLVIAVLIDRLPAMG